MKKKISLENNRFEVLFQKAKKRKFAILAVAISSLLLIEVLVTCFYAQRVSQKKAPASFFAQLTLGRVLFPSLLDEPKLAGQKYIGDLMPHKAAWKEMLPADSLLGWRVGKNIAATHLSTYFYVSNSQGFMSSGDSNFFYVKNKPKDVFRIIMVGGSTVFGQGAKIPSENLPAQLRLLLEKKFPDTKLEVINAGVGGYASNMEFLYLMSELVYYHPDLVVVYNGWNNHGYGAEVSEYGDALNPLKTSAHYLNADRINSSYTIGGNLRFLFEATGNAIRDAVVTLFDKSASLHLVKRLVGKAEIRVANQRPKVKQAGDYSFKTALIYKNDLENMIYLSERHKFKIALFLQPIMGVDQKPLTEEETKIRDVLDEMNTRRKFYADARKIFSELKKKNRAQEVCAADLSQSFNEVKEAVYADSGHLYLKGNQIIAQKIFEHLMHCKMLKSLAKGSI